MTIPSTGSISAGFSAVLPDEQATIRLAMDVANALEPGDYITLSGDLGAGKTTFARMLIRYLAADDTVEVPSPTFTLMQTYELPRFPVVHTDLYRLSGPAELSELGFDDFPPGAVVLIEWPDRAPGFLPADRLDITLTLAPKLKLEFRQARVTGFGAFAPRVERIAAMRDFIAESGYSDARRWPMAGDASARRYERMALGDQRLILMNSPPKPDGPAVRDGKSYSAIAHLAETVVPFVAMAKGLRGLGLSAPEIRHADIEHGLLLIEDLGDEKVIQGEPPEPITERYEAAVDTLLQLHEKPLPTMLPVAPHLQYELPAYDMEAFQIELELLLDWFLPKFGAKLPDEARSAYLALWQDALKPALEQPKTWVLRDYHSPNLLWLPRRRGTARIGLLDFQDALVGPPAYDLASLLQDARIDVPEVTEVGLLGRYVRRRRVSDPQFDGSEFIKTYVALAAQRASKILGIFARLDLRDGKPQYLRHMPRVWAYLQRSLAHPSMQSLHEWYGEYVPTLKTI